MLKWIAPSCAIVDTHRSILVLEANAEFVHRIDTHPQAVQDIVEDDNTPFLLLVLGEAILCVDQSHLLQNRRLSTLSSSCIAPLRLAIDLRCDATRLAVGLRWNVMAYPIARV